jgi:hypothetical protein
LNFWLAFEAVVGNSDGYGACYRKNQEYPAFFLHRFGFLLFGKVTVFENKRQLYDK